MSWHVEKAPRDKRILANWPHYDRDGVLDMPGMAVVHYYDGEDPGWYDDFGDKVSSKDPERWTDVP